MQVEGRINICIKKFEKICIIGLTRAGSGKTRTVIELCDVLLNKGWIKNILFLADRNSLVTQAKRSFVNLLPDLSCTNLCEEKDNYHAHCVFSMYQMMIHLIDDAKDEHGKIFSSGHFDLVNCPTKREKSLCRKSQCLCDFHPFLTKGLNCEK